MVLLISDNWAKSKWTATEYGAAYALGKKIIPVLIEDIPGNINIDINRSTSVDAKNEYLDFVATQLEEAL